MADWYARLIRALCEQAGIPDWHAVVNAQQIDANGFIVTLFPDADRSSALVLYVELGRHRADIDGRLLQHLLESNIGTAQSAGAFGLVPGRGTIAYRALVADADQISGAHLMSRILDLIARATSQLHVATAHAAQNSRGGPIARPKASPLQKGFFHDR